MSRYALGTMIVSVNATVIGVALAAAAMAALSPNGPGLPQLAFVAGPLLFLALLAWRRRNHLARSRLIFWLDLVIAVGGLGILTFDYFHIRNEQPNLQTLRTHPLVVPLIQWAVVGGVWLILVIQEGREKRAAKKFS